MKPALGYLTISRLPPRRRRSPLRYWLLLAIAAMAFGVIAVVFQLGLP